MALTYLYTSHQGHDNKLGLSVADIVDTYDEPTRLVLADRSLVVLIGRNEKG